jgi:H+-transporting ATPase
LNKETPTADLVPGDVIVVRLGDVIPADAILLSSGEETEGHVEELKVDQSSLTGESLPATKHVGDEVYSGSTAKQGEMKALVTSTGVNTFFGKAASLISSVDEIGHFQRVLRSVGWFCIILIAAWVAIELIIQFAVRRAPCVSLSECYTLDNMLVLIVGGIPIAMPTVLSVTMAIGAQRLATKKAIVSRLTAVEELAGMDILCSDKTGTLTKNKLTVADPISYNADVHPQEILFYAALASTPETGDSIDMAMVEHCNEEMTARLKSWHMVNFQPFDPISKKTAAKVRDDNGKVMWTSKGAPQVMLNLAANKEEIRSEAQYDIDELAKHGYRSLGVSRSEDGTNWEMVGMIPMFDPPRDDTKETIEKIKDWGVGLKMITGDQLAIAKETARLLGMNQNILPSKALRMPRRRISAEFGMSVTDLVETADGFAEVFPEDKFAIVKKLQRMKHVVGMTGDGVNDAPALKKANIGIAVAGATDAARGASDIVLTDAGLSVIVDAIIGSRKIFQRMKNYATYSIAVAVRVVFTFGLLTTGFDFYFPTIAIVILALLNDGCMLTISKDRVKPSRVPDKWSLKEIYSVAIVIGLYLSASTIVLYHITINTDFWARTFNLPQLDQNSIRGLIYLQVSLSGLAAIFVTRAQGFSYTERPSWLVLGAFLLAQVVASVLCAYGLGGYPNNGVNDFGGSGWGYVLVAWIWCIIWYVPLDFLKFLTRGIARGHVVWPTRDYVRRPVHQIQALQPTTTIGYTRAGLTFVNRTLVKEKKDKK